MWNSHLQYYSSAGGGGSGSGGTMTSNTGSSNHCGGYENTGSYPCGYYQPYYNYSPSGYSRTQATVDYSQTQHTPAPVASQYYWVSSQSFLVSL